MLPFCFSYYIFKLMKYGVASERNKLVYLMVFNYLGFSLGNLRDILFFPPDKAFFNIFLFYHTGQIMLHRLLHKTVKQFSSLWAAVEKVIIQSFQLVKNLKNKWPLAVILDDF